MSLFLAHILTSDNCFKLLVKILWNLEIFNTKNFGSILIKRFDTYYEAYRRSEMVMKLQNLVSLYSGVNNLDFNPYPDLSVTLFAVSLTLNTNDRLIIITMTYILLLLSSHVWTRWSTAQVSSNGWFRFINVKKCNNKHVKRCGGN